MIFRSLFIFALLLSALSDSHAEVLKNQMAVIANKQSPEGLALAKYYLQARGIPEKQLITVNLPTESETIERETFETKLVAPIREELVNRDLSAQVRVLVTFFGVPLRVLAPEAKGDEKQALLDALNYQKEARTELQTLTTKAEAFVGKTSEPFEEPEKEGSDLRLVARARNAIAEGAKKSFPEEEKKTSRVKLTEFITQFGGLASVVESIKIPESTENAAAATALEKLRHDVQAAQKLLQALDETRTPENRKRANLLTRRVFGASGLLARSANQIRILKYPDADASIDSELSFLWFDREHYALTERVPNPYVHTQLKEGKPVASALPIMLVSRVDGGTAAKAKQLIDFALRAEKEGISGTAYVDARGLPASDKSYGSYDNSLRKLVSLLKDETEIDVEWDNTDPRITEAKNTALYCGWYKLRHYDDIFSFVPGAIGYHIASEEAVSLHDPKETGWCKNAIDHGITVTLGAVAEPYLDSFPRPLEFFGLLLTGRYSLIEAYALTNPYISWRMVLIGDPLYQPWKKEFVTGKELADEDDRAATLNPLPPSPLSATYEDPKLVRKKLRERREQLLKELDAFYAKLVERLEQQKSNKK